MSSLSVGATLMLYDGYPFQNAGNILWDYVDAERISIFGTNAKYLSALEQQKKKPRESHSLDALKTILSTGSVLMPESFDYVYRDIKPEVCLSSIAGMGLPLKPIHPKNAKRAWKTSTFPSPATPGRWCAPMIMWWKYITKSTCSLKPMEKHQPFRKCTKCGIGICPNWLRR